MTMALTLTSSAWLALIIAGIFEWGWPLGLKLGLSDQGLRWGWLSFSLASANVDYGSINAPRAADSASPSCAM
jgi:quaternary ammonium compound-resistance protein SugE